MIARPPHLDCPSCSARAGEWCHYEEGRVCVRRQIRATAVAKGREAITMAAQRRAEWEEARRMSIRACAERRKSK